MANDAISHTIRVGLLGCGNVGGALVPLIQQQADVIEARTGLRLVLTRVAVRNMSRDRGISFDDGTAARFISQGITEWSGSYSRYIDSAASPWSETPGTTGSATLTALSGATYAGTILVTGVSTSVSKTGGAIVQNVTFQGDSTLTIASPS